MTDLGKRTAFLRRRFSLLVLLHLRKLTERSRKLKNEDDFMKDDNQAIPTDPSLFSKYPSSMKQLR